MAGMYFAILLVLAVLYSIAKYGQQRAWDRRPKRLCMNCKLVAQPLQLKGTKEWYCPTCQAKNPVPLSSPAAVEYFAGHR